MKKLLLAALFLVNCLTLESVTQPTSVVVGERFTITVAGTIDSTGGAVALAWLAMRLPDGFYVDSICFRSSVGIAGTVTSPFPEVEDRMRQSHPPDPNTVWWAFATDSLATDSAGTFDADVYLYAGGCTVPGSYTVDYFLGTQAPNWFQIEDSILDQSMDVVAAAVAREHACSRARAERVWPSVFRDRVNIAVPEPDDVGVYDAGGRLVRTLRVEQTGFWDGTDEYGRRLPAGAYLVRGDQVSGRVTLLD
jgi:hypothetical protein